jgi:hypothetical protein
MPDLNEAKTRALLINPQLEKAGWNLADRSQVQFEVPVQGYDPTPWNGFTDFCLYHPDGTVLAVIEAKRTARNAREGEEQLRQYVAEISRKQKIPPFGLGGRPRASARDRRLLLARRPGASRSLRLQRSTGIPALANGKTACARRGILLLTRQPLRREGHMPINNIGRRELIAALGGVAAAWPLAARACSRL